MRSMSYTREDAEGPLAEKIAEIESRALAEVQGQIDWSRSRTDSNRDFEWLEVRLDGSFPRTKLIVIFNWTGFPDSLCGNQTPVWNKDGRRPGRWVYDRWGVTDFLLFTRLDLGNTRNPKLPPREADPATGIMWHRRYG